MCLSAAEPSNACAPGCEDNCPLGIGGKEILNLSSRAFVKILLSVASEDNGSGVRQSERRAIQVGNLGFPAGFHSGNRSYGLLPLIEALPPRIRTVRHLVRNSCHSWSAPEQFPALPCQLVLGRA